MSSACTLEQSFQAFRGRQSYRSGPDRDHFGRGDLVEARYVTRKERRDESWEGLCRQACTGCRWNDVRRDVDRNLGVENGCRDGHSYESSKVFGKNPR